MDAQVQGTIVSIFKDVPDPRGRNIRYPLVSLITMALFAVISGAEDWWGVVAYVARKESWLRSFLELPETLPSMQTYRRVFSRLSPVALERAILGWTQSLTGSTEGLLICMDGKSLCQSFRRGWEKNAMSHMVSMFVSDHGQVLSQVQCNGKGKELSAIMELLQLVDVTGAVITIDALGCQTAVAERIIEAQANYILSAKDNQKSTAQGVRATMKDLILDQAKGRDVPVDYFEEVDESHGRKVRRRVWLSGAVQYLPKALREKWPSVQSMALVERSRQDYGDFINPGRETLEECVYISSLDTMSAQQMAGFIRGHWSIENQLHWQLDVSFGEDRSRLRVGHGAQNMSRLRRIALNLLKADKRTVSATNKTKLSVKTKRHSAGWDDKYLLELLVGQAAQHRNRANQATEA